MELDREAVAGAKAPGELFGKKDGTVLAAGAAERDHEAFEAAGLVVGDARVDERVNAGEELVDAFLLIEIFDDGRVPAGEFLEFFFAAGIGEAAAVEDETAAVSAVVFGKFTVKRKTVYADDEIVGFFGDAMELFGAEHAFEGAHQRW